MNNREALRQLLVLIEADGMQLIWCTVPVRDVVYIKGIIEAYPGVAAVHAPPGRVQSERATFAVATTPGMAAMTQQLIDDLAREAGVERSTTPEGFA